MTLDNSWHAISLQAVIFLAAPPPPGFTLFQALTGESPNTVEDRPREAARREVGELDGGRLRLEIAITPLRIDIVVQPVQPTEATLDANSQFLMLGPFEEEARRFGSLIVSWLAKQEIDCLRLSFVSVLVSEAKSRGDSYTVLARSLKSVQVSEKMRDMTFRVNWRAPYDGVEEGFLNRLTTWSAFFLRFAAGLTGAANNAPKVELGERNFARLDLDINSPAERTKPLPREEMPKIFTRFVELAVENANVGECP